MSANGESNLRKRLLDSAEKELPKDKKVNTGDHIVFNDSDSGPDSDISDTTDTSDHQLPNKPTMSLQDNMQTILQKLSKLDTLDVIQTDVHSIKTSMNDLQQSLFSTQQELVEAKGELKELKRDCDVLRSEVGELREKTEHLESRLIKMNQYSRRENMIVKGVRETDGEDCEKTVKDLFLEKLGVGPFQLQRVHRLGGVRDRTKPRPIIVRFALFSDKLTVMKNKKKLMGTEVFIHDDLLPDIEEQQRRLRPIAGHIRRIDSQAKVVLVEDKLIYKGKSYTHENIQDIPVDMTELGTITTDTHVLFAGDCTPLSNMYHTTFTVDKQEYNSVEQYYQHCKCIVNGKSDKAEEILKAKTSWEAMKIGKQVKVGEQWSQTEGRKILEKGILAKASECEEFIHLLKAKKDKIFAEATHHKLYGTGLPLGNKENKDPTKWRGKNLMGELLTELVKHLRL